MPRWTVGLCSAVVSAAALLTTSNTLAQSTETTAATPTRKTSLQQRLEKGLKARRKSEFVYIAEVVDLVEKGKLPQKVVDGAFFQSRRKRRAMQHFQFSLAARGKKLRLPTPKFDPLAP